MLSIRHTALLAFALVLPTALTLQVQGTAMAQSQSTAPRPCCWDRWDPGQMDRHMWGGQHGMGRDQTHRMQRHWTFMHQSIPAEYRGQRNPFTQTAEVIREGGALYAKQCAACHGSTGLGDGEAGKSLSPSPALLAHLVQMPMAVDEYLFWSVSEGGRQFGSAMPAFKGTLTADQIWKVVAYMRAGFPAAAQQ